jgi:hypothetical protein
MDELEEIDRYILYRFRTVTEKILKARRLRSSSFTFSTILFIVFALLI